MARSKDKRSWKAGRENVGTYIYHGVFKKFGICGGCDADCHYSV